MACRVTHTKAIDRVNAWFDSFASHALTAAETFLKRLTDGSPNFSKWSEICKEIMRDGRMFYACPDGPNSSVRPVSTFARLVLMNGVCCRAYFVPYSSSLRFRAICRRSVMEHGLKDLHAHPMISGILSGPLAWLQLRCASPCCPANVDANYWKPGIPRCAAFPRAVNHIRRGRKSSDQNAHWLRGISCDRHRIQ